MMSRISVNRKKVKLKGLLGIRARLVLLALMLVGPLMLDRIRSLESTRARQIALTSSEFSQLAEHSAEAQREVIASVQAVLKSAAYIHASTAKVGHGCAIMRASLQVDLPWISTLSAVGIDGKVVCSTLPALVGVDLSDRSYFKNAIETQDFVLSDYLFSRGTKQPSIVAAYPISAVDAGGGAVMVAAINLDWMSRTMNNLGGRPGVSAVLVDSQGTVLATPSDQASMIGRPMEDRSLLSSLAASETASDGKTESVSVTASDGSRHTVSFARVGSTGTHLVVSIDEARIAATVNREIRTAYLQLALVCLFVLLGALVAAERIIIQPITMMATIAQRFGRGDWSARAARIGLPAEFVPLARAFNAMAAKLSERERELIATNDRLTVIASIDMLSGLANRRGFQSRLDFEWLKAQQDGREVALLMIDVDHFKLFNDTYGHPEGDVCLTQLGETLAAIAHGMLGFAARYGGEEFCLLLPNRNSEQASRVGEMVRAAVENLAMPHATSLHRQVTVSVGVASATPNETQQPSDLIEAADAALYAAKRRGRNAVVEHGFVRASDTGLSLAG
jgi:diguanylate cyclase (GGDEF)-like protein